MLLRVRSALSCCGIFFVPNKSCASTGGSCDGIPAARGFDNGSDDGRLRNLGARDSDLLNPELAEDERLRRAERLLRAYNRLRRELCAKVGDGLTG